MVADSVGDTDMPHHLALDFVDNHLVVAGAVADFVAKNRLVAVEAVDCIADLADTPVVVVVAGSVAKNRPVVVEAVDCIADLVDTPVVAVVAVQAVDYSHLARIH